MSKKRNNYNLGLRHKEQSQRQMKVSAAINAALISCFRKGSMLNAKLLDCPLTITKITVSGDLKLANCFFLPFNTKLSPAEILEALNESKFQIRKFVTQEINLKYSPELRFFHDNAFEQSLTLDKLIKKVDDIS